MSQKLKFSFIYVFIALSILIPAITLIRYLWYPHPLLQAAGVQNLLMIIVLVNIGLAFGLAITIFRKNEHDFVKDIAISMLVQLLFLLVSIYGVYKIKPVWIAYNVDRFELILNTDLINTNAHSTDNVFKTPSFFSPQYVGVDFSKDNEERKNNMFDEILQGISIAQRPERYIPFEQVRTKIKDRAQDLKLLENYNNKDEVQYLLSKYPKADSFVPLQAKSVDMTVLLDKEADNQVLAIVDLRPW